MGDILIVSKYYVSTSLMKLAFPDVVKETVVLSDTLTGNGVNYRFTSVIVGDQMDTEVRTMSYSNEQRCKIFQGRNVNHMTLPFKIDNNNLKRLGELNTNYEREL